MRGSSTTAQSSPCSTEKISKVTEVERADSFNHHSFVGIRAIEEILKLIKPELLREKSINPWSALSRPRKTLNLALKRIQFHISVATLMKSNAEGD